MKMSVQSIEMFNNLAKLVILPEEVIHLYISNCISKCENMNDDKSLQNRLVRVLCLVIQSLIRNRIIDVNVMIIVCSRVCLLNFNQTIWRHLKEIMIELQPFCIEFSSIKEASALYRFIKQITNDSTASSANKTNTSNNGSPSATPK